MSDSRIRFGFVVWATVAFLLAWGGGTVASARPKGPLQVKNRFPMHLGLLTPMPEGPAVLSQGRLTATLAVDYSSIFFQSRSSHWQVLMDMETTVIDIRLGYGFSEKLMVDLELPFIRMSDGFLDGFLEQYHSTFGFPNYGREKRPQNEFAYVVQQDGNDLINPLSESFRPGDIFLGAKLALPRAEGGHLQSSLRLAVQAPTGDSEQWMGNGGWDWGLALPTRVEAGDFSYYFTPSLAINSAVGSKNSRLETKPLWGLLAAVEFEYSADWSWIGQVNIYSPAFVKTGIDDLDQNSIELAFGCRFKGPLGLLYEIAFCEDLTRAAPDFTLHLALTW